MGKELAFVPGYGDVKGNIFPKMVNAETEAELIESAPHVRFLDLAMIFVIALSTDEGITPSFVVKDALAEAWGVTAEELRDAAMGNMWVKAPAALRSIDEVLASLMGGGMSVPAAETLPMFVLLDGQGMYAPACMTDGAYMEWVAERLGGSFYILPSSVHELIILPASDCGNPEKLDGMVREVNEEEVEACDVLSDHAYFYRRGSLFVTCA